MTQTASTPRPRPTESAKSVLLTMLGEFVLPNGGEVWTGTLVDGLAALGYSDRNARQAIARLRDDGVIAPEKHGRKTRWRLTDDGDRLLRDGAERIYQFGRRTEPWDGRWLVVVCSIPESQREKRRRFQTQLAFAGFGFLSSTIAVSPHLSAEQTANEVLERLRLVDMAIVLRAETGMVTPDGELLGRSWDLDALGSSYEQFVATFGAVEPVGPETSFCEMIRLVHAWRHFPFSDPELPAELLPPGWAGNVARHLFDDARVTWSTEATVHYKRLEARHDR
ncbi:MAG: PaaX family transcriptional regulator [Acidimicrobiia bacterium]|nr:PaaX family transcriptional regulator [Acidimicrobiia bacterium]